MDGRRFSFQQLRTNAGFGADGQEPSARSRFLFHFTLFGVAFAVAMLYQGMRPIMRLGGMVASGGPYAIVHPAPSWVWIMPVSVLFGLACLFVHLFSGDPGKVSLMPLAWPGLFLSLGWNFLEFAFAPPGGGLAWGWLVCGVLFVLMGGVPLLLFLLARRARAMARREVSRGFAPYALQGLWIGAGIVAALYVFRAVAR